MDQQWEFSVSENEEGRRHVQCPSCKRWFHCCSNCSYPYFPEDTYCSENCWKAAGSPENPVTNS